VAKLIPYTALEDRSLRGYGQAEVAEPPFGIGCELRTGLPEQSTPRRNIKQVPFLREQELDAGQGPTLLFHIEQAPRHGMEYGWHGFSGASIN
jgi:hypothetical protein